MMIRNPPGVAQQWWPSLPLAWSLSPYRSRFGKRTSSRRTLFFQLTDRRRQSAGEHASLDYFYRQQGRNLKWRPGGGWSRAETRQDKEERRFLRLCASAVAEPELNVVFQGDFGTETRTIWGIWGLRGRCRNGTYSSSVTSRSVPAMRTIILKILYRKIRRTKFK